MLPQSEMHRHTTRVVVRVVLGAALLVAVVMATAQMVGTWRAAEHRLPWRESDRRVARANGVNPAVLDRIAALIPPSAGYDLDFAPTLASSDHGQAFSAMLRARLLPRIQVSRSDARWLVVWGARPSAGSATRDAGLVHPGEPPVVVVSNGG